MPRPRKETRLMFYDQFADWDIEDQAKALEALTESHRQKVRMLKREKSPKLTEKESEQPLLDGVGTK